MNKTQIEIIKQKINLEINNEKSNIFENYAEFFLEKNLHTNLISKNDAKLLFEKHIFDSLTINLFFEKHSNKKKSTLLDIGTGGGFPSVPIAILYDNINVYAIDSIRKKIKIIEEIKEEFKLANLFPICDRVENLKQQKFDYITTRAVAPLETILKYAIPHLKKDGYFIAYKSKKATEEIDKAQKAIKALGVKLVEIIEYTLPLEEKHERNLIIFKQK